MADFEDIEARLRTASRTVTGKFSDRIRAVEAFKPAVIGVGALGAAIIAAARLAEGNLAIGLTSGGLVLAFVCAVAAAVLDYRKLEIGADLRTAEDLAEEALAEGRRLRADFVQRLAVAEQLLVRERDAAVAREQHRNSLLSALRSMNEAAERCPSTMNLESVIESMLDASMTDVQDALGFGEREHWTLSVFQCVQHGRTHEMRRIVARWWDRAEERKPPRAWKSGDGYTGYAWANNCEVIESDTSLDEPMRRYQVPKGMTLESDAEKYRSVACILVKAGKDDRPWGAVTATSNKAGRFERNPTDVRSLNVDVLRQISSLIAVQASLRLKA